MMNYTAQEVIQYVKEDGVKFIRLAFCDPMGRQKNVAIMPSELERAFDTGIAIDGSAITGFGQSVHSDLLLHPEAGTLTGLPWRPESGRVVRMFCRIYHPDGRAFACDSRRILADAVAAAAERGFSFSFGPEMEFYLFKSDENGESSGVPHDRAGYMDIAPGDKGENIRREICLTLEKMGIRPETSHHEEGPGQNEIDFRYADPMTAADNAQTFKAVAAAVAAGSGLCADFTPKPIQNAPGSGMHVNFSVKSRNAQDYLPQAIAGIMEKITDITAFLNPCEASYMRLGGNKAPCYVSWSAENRSQLIRIPAASGEYRRAELRSPDPAANPYLAFALLIYAGLYGIENDLELPVCADFDLFSAPPELLRDFRRLPESLDQAKRLAAESAFVAGHLPKALVDFYCGR